MEPLARRTLMVENPRLENVTLAAITEHDVGVVVSRIQRAGATIVETATPRTVLQQNDLLLAVGTATALDKFSTLVGPVLTTDLTQRPGRICSERMVITRKEVMGKSIAALQLGERYDATIMLSANPDSPGCLVFCQLRRFRRRHATPGFARARRRNFGGVW